jgi:hypothetical protein
MRADACPLPPAAAAHAIGDPASMPPIASGPAEPGQGAHPRALAEHHARGDHDPALACRTPGPGRASSQTMATGKTEARRASSTRGSGDRARMNLVTMRPDP